MVVLIGERVTIVKLEDQSWGDVIGPALWLMYIFLNLITEDIIHI